MLPVDFDEANFTFTKPISMTDEECSDLRVWKGNDNDGQPRIISYWKPNKEDIEAINAGKGIYLDIFGQGMPPVCIYTESPFTVTE